MANASLVKRRGSKTNDRCTPEEIVRSKIFLVFLMEHRTFCRNLKWHLQRRSNAVSSVPWNCLRKDSFTLYSIHENLKHNPREQIILTIFYFLPVFIVIFSDLICLQYRNLFQKNCEIYYYITIT